MNDCSTDPRRFSSRTAIAAACTVTLAVLSISGSLSAETPIDLRVLTYNIHHGEGNDGKLDLQRIADVIISARPDLVCLQEVDRRTHRTGNVDQATELARLTGLNVVFEGNLVFQGGDYGNAILSRFPISHRQNHFLPVHNQGEQRGVLIADLALNASAKANEIVSPRLRLFATHLDHRRDDAERCESAKVIAGLLDSPPHSPHAEVAILAGDLNATPDSQVLREFERDWTVARRFQKLATIPAEQPRDQIDFVLFRPGSRWIVRDVRVLNEPVASDHRPLLAELVFVPTSHVRIDFRVRPPAPLPAEEKIFVSGNIAELGGWRPDAVALIRNSAGEYCATVAVPQGFLLAFKFTRGTWLTVEKGINGEEIPNRVLRMSDRAIVKAQVASWASSSNTTSTPASTATGLVRHHRDFESQHLNNRRTIRVWLPPGYDDSETRYPVVYLHDGQNLFDAATAAFRVEWRADETAARLIDQKVIPPVILVGVDNTADRIGEYTPTPFQGRGGKGATYARFLTDELKPMIDRTYRTRPERDHTTTGGSSLGGLISLYLARHHSDVFGQCLAISPALAWDNGALLRELLDDPHWSANCRVWLDIGTLEGNTREVRQSAVQHCRRLAESLSNAGRRPGRDFQYLEVVDGEHHESDWSRRFDQVLKFAGNR